MPANIQKLVRDRRDSEMMLIRSRDALLADLLDCPVPPASSGTVGLRAGSDLRPGGEIGRGLEVVLRRGWSAPEAWGVWSEGDRATLELSFDSAATFPLTVEVELEGFVRPGIAQSVTISVNERRVGIVEFEPSSPERVQAIEIGGSDLSANRAAEIAFDISNPTAPRDVEGSSDRRKLGVAIHRLRVC